MKTEEYIEEIRKSEGLQNAILRKIAVDDRNREADFYLVTDRTYSVNDEEHALSVTEKYLPAGTVVTVHIAKLVADEELITRRITEILKEKFPAAASFVTNEDISVEMTEGGARFYIEIGVKERGLFEAGNILDSVAEGLQKTFCGSFIGNVRTVEREEEEFVPDEYIPPAEYLLPVRVFNIEKYSKIDGGEKAVRAVYMSDLREGENVSICGEITDVYEKTTTAGKPFFIFTVNDTTAAIKATYFSKKKTVEEIRKLKAGDKIVLSGDYTPYKGNLSFTAKYINMGSYPENFVPEEKPSHGVPPTYQAVTPESFTDYNQSGLFEADRSGGWLNGKTFVVYDIETTGLTSSPALGAKMDAIIELGAVKIIDGEVKEKFSTFVKADRRLSAEIISLTGITDDMLVGAPDISVVIADFYKFSDGSAMVGHNALLFDSRFINYYAGLNDFSFKNKIYDTLNMAQKHLRLSNYKLNTIADHYGVKFNHHRAFDDALATAKIFLAMVREGFLP